MVTVRDLENIRESLLDIFPDAVRGSVAKTRWGDGRKQLHLSYWVAADTVGGLIVQATGNLLYFVEWDTNSGYTKLFAESDIDVFIERVKSNHGAGKHTITRMVGELR
jgi:hypothetical protein